MFRFKLIAWALISLNLLGQEIPDYKAEYTYTNSKFSMDGIRELTTKEDGIRILKFEGKLPMGRIKISSNFVEEDDFYNYRFNDNPNFLELFKLTIKKIIKLKKI